MEKRVVIAGCSGGGKSTLLRELAQRGYRTVEEPGRRIIGDALTSHPSALPWNDLAAFAVRAIAMAQEDMAAHFGTAEWVFFDRGLIDAVAALHFAKGHTAIDLMADANRYAPTVFFAPPWEEIYVTDDMRQHGFAEGAEEAARLEAAYRDAGYQLHMLPKVSVAERADWIEQTLYNLDISPR